MKYLFTIGLLIFVSAKVFSCDSLFIKYHVVVKEITQFDYFYKIKVENLNNNAELQIFSLKKPSLTNFEHKVSIGDTLHICLMAKQVLEIAPGFNISYHPQSKWVYKKKVVLAENEVPFISCNLVNLTYSWIGCCPDNK